MPFTKAMSSSRFICVKSGSSSVTADLSYPPANAFAFYRTASAEESHKLMSQVVTSSGLD